jgi:hypothetical protein
MDLIDFEPKNFIIPISGCHLSGLYVAVEYKKNGLEKVQVGCVPFERFESAIAYGDQYNTQQYYVEVYYQPFLLVSSESCNFFITELGVKSPLSEYQFKVSPEECPPSQTKIVGYNDCYLSAGENLNAAYISFDNFSRFWRRRYVKPRNIVRFVTSPSNFGSLQQDYGYKVFTFTYEWFEAPSGVNSKPIKTLCTKSEKEVGELWV